MCFMRQKDRRCTRDIIELNPSRAAKRKIPGKNAEHVTDSTFLFYVGFFRTVPSYTVPVPIPPFPSYILKLHHALLCLENFVHYFSYLSLPVTTSSSSVSTFYTFLFLMRISPPPKLYTPNLDPVVHINDQKPLYYSLDMLNIRSLYFTGS